MKKTDLIKRTVLEVLEENDISHDNADFFMKCIDKLESLYMRLAMANNSKLGFVCIFRSYCSFKSHNNMCANPNVCPSKVKQVKNKTTSKNGLKQQFERY